jgi:ribosome-associated toxin RatA of RatAB toxin-antitoxin module
MTAPHRLGPMPADLRMTTIDQRVVRTPCETIFRLAADVARWPEYLPHYRYVRFHEHRSDGGGTVEMSANRPFGPFRWPTWWTSLMSVTTPGENAPPSIRFRHIAGITRGMEVEWTFVGGAAHETLVRIVHVWNGPGWPLIGLMAARRVIGPVFVHGIASRTLAGLAYAAERMTRYDSSSSGVASG